MSNGRSFRRNLAASKHARQPRPRFPYGGPSLSSVRRWLKQLEANGDIERKGINRTGEPGRPAVLYGLTEQGRRHPQWTSAQLTDMITRAIRDRRFKDVPLLLRLLEIDDPEQAKRIYESLVTLGNGAGSVPRGRC